MKKTKIVCTMGPNSNDENIMRRLVKEGMDIARFNFSHGSHEEQKGRMDMLKKIREEEKKPVAILLDTKGTGNPYRCFERRKEGIVKRRRDKSL